VLAFLKNNRGGRRTEKEPKTKFSVEKVGVKARKPKEERGIERRLNSSEKRG